MGRMAAFAGGGLDRIILVGLFKGALLRIMARQAQRRFRRYQQIGLIGAVGEVAALAGFRSQCLVDGFLLEAFTLMTLKANLSALCLEQITFHGCMRIVAVDALAIFQAGMDKGFIEPDVLIVVAGKTKLIAFSFQQQLGHNAVTQVAVLTFFFLDHRMHIRHREIFGGKIGVAVQTFLALKLEFTGPPGRRRRTGGKVNEPDCQKQEAGGCVLQYAGRFMRMHFHFIRSAW
jgi:hypothetical protein